MAVHAGSRPLHRAAPSLAPACFPAYPFHQTSSRDIVDSADIPSAIRRVLILRQEDPAGKVKKYPKDNAERYRTLLNDLGRLCALMEAANDCKMLECGHSARSRAGPRGFRG